ncbi:hypothetical protein [Roseiconus lacunae]|uniref:Sulfotransferase domain-containing protein n=1 Tax=Roseiconus lacunae TaxID=2605694 RepID=A0ABT7PCD4_9BACT|nr:hypothetical protein [Roseiconus lacunae]MDM4014148.1 hypothetical protein [Roseiconus lacunae]
MRSEDEPPTFHDRGHVYGPIRISANPDGSVARLLVHPATREAFIRDRIAIFFIRDPRDIIVSSYYSFGFTHALSSVDEIRESQLAVRGEIQEQSLDEYAIKQASVQRAHFDRLFELLQICERGVLLKYEDMIGNFDRFASQLRTRLSVEDEVMEAIYQRTRPLKTEDPASHRRSGEVNGFRSKLRASTIELVNDQLGENLNRFGYRH